jgi:hypothetical protein
LRPIVSKDESGQHSPRTASERTAGSGARIEEPPKRACAKRSVILDRRTSSHYVVALVLVILAVSNAYFMLACRAVERERANALGMLLIAAEGALSESTHILNLTVERRRIDLELWDVLQQDLIWQSRLYHVIASLDMHHEPYWMQIQDSVVSLERVVSSVKETYASIFIRLLNLTDKQTSQIVAVRDILVIIETDAFPAHVILGANPEVVIPDENMMRAAEAAARLNSELEKLQEYLTPTPVLPGG